LLLAVAVTAYRVYTEPYKADVTLVVGGWNLLNLLLAGCALGVVSERGELTATRRVKVTRRCEFGLDEQWYPATIDNVSVNGARVNVYAKNLETLPLNKRGLIRFTPYSSGKEEILPVAIRNTQVAGDIVTVGCLYLPEAARDHSLIADLIFANSQQWTQFQMSRRGNPGLLRGTIWFLGLAFYQTSRGIIYFFSSPGARDKARMVAEAKR
jgi:cellulose synthase (UDP-forming)